MPRKEKNKRADKRYMVRLDVGMDGDKRIRKCFYGASKEEAEAKRNEYFNTHLTNITGERNITLSEWADKWLITYNNNVEYNTLQSRKSAVNSIKSFEFKKDGYITYDRFGDIPIKEVLPLHVQEFMNGHKNKSKSDIRTARQILNNVLDMAAENGLIPESPYKKIKSPRGTYSGHRALPTWERELINENWQKNRAGLWAMIMLYAGLRRGELIALKGEYIDLENRILHVKNAVYFKNNQAEEKSTKTVAGERNIPIVAPLYEALIKVLGNNYKGYICLSADGKQLSETAFRRGWHSFNLMCERAINKIEPYEDTEGWRRDLSKKKIENYIEIDISAHDLRYTFATMLFDADVDVKTAQYLLGHTDIMTTMKIYTQLSDEKKSRSFDKFIKHFS